MAEICASVAPGSDAAPEPDAPARVAVASSIATSSRFNAASVIGIERVADDLPVRADDGVRAGYRVISILRAEADDDVVRLRVRFDRHVALRALAPMSAGGSPARASALARSATAAEVRIAT